jgi:hypothetical protein
MSARLDPPWKVLASPSTPAVDRCVDIFSRPDGTFGFEEFRRDPEDMGAWTPIAYYSGPTRDENSSPRQTRLPPPARRSLGLPEFSTAHTELLRCSAPGRRVLRHRR